MQCYSQTWQQLLEWLLQPLLNGVISQSEASELWDHSLVTEEEFYPLPRHLNPACERLHLWSLEVKSPRQ